MESAWRNCLAAVRCALEAISWGLPVIWPLHPRTRAVLAANGRLARLAPGVRIIEPVGDLEVRSAELTATEIGADEVPLLVDELPLFALLAAHARGESRVTGAAELRVKETDRIEAVVDALHAIGARAQALEDGFTVRGVPARPRGGRVEARGDHRIAMLGAVAGLASREGVEIVEADCVAVSFPGFFDLLDVIAQR